MAHQKINLCPEILTFYPKRRLTPLFVTVVLIFFNQFTLARTVTQPSPLVEVEVADDIGASYKASRGLMGFSFSASQQNQKTKDYISPLDSKSYEEIFNSKSLVMTEIRAGPKINLGPVSAVLDLSFAKGDVKAFEGSIGSSLAITKTGIGLSLILDGLMNEPYVAPYIGMHLCRIDFIEKDNSSGDREEAGTIDRATSITAGALILLDWIEPNVANFSKKEVGLQNTHLDLFMQKTNSANLQSGNGNLNSDLALGVGIRLEF